MILLNGIINIYKLFKNFKTQNVEKIVMLSYEPYIILLIGLFMDLTRFKIFIKSLTRV